MADCNNPTFYPVILSSIDGECVFTEYDVSTTLYNRIWEEIEGWAWPCATQIFGTPPGSPGNPPTSIPNYGWVPNHPTPGSTTTIYLTPSALYGDPNLGGTTTLNTTYCLSNYTELTNPGSNVIAKLAIDGTVKQNGTVFAWTGDVTNVTGPTTIDSKDVYTLTVANVQDTGQSDWDGAESGTTPFNIQLKSNAPSVLTGLHDVTVTETPTNDDVLVWSTDKWVPAAQSGGGGSADSILRVPTSVAENTVAPDRALIGFTVNANTLGTENILDLRKAGSLRAYMDYNGYFFVKGLESMAGQTLECPPLRVTSAAAKTQLKDTDIGSQLSIGIEAGQTSAPFVVSDSGGSHVWYIDASANLFTSGGIDVSGNRITRVGTPTAITDAATKLYVDQSSSGVSGDYILKDGSVVFTGDQSMGSNKLTSVTNPTALQDAATKYYVDLMASSPSGNYILKDGSVDFTGAQAGVAFGATEGVSGATVSGTTIEGQTVYAPSVSGATVSGTSVKAVLYSGAGILDEDAMGSDSNTHLATQQSIKAYVDSQAHTDASGYWTQVTATSAIYYSSGNVGIGTTTPSATLEVVGDVSATTIEALEGVSGATVSGTTVEGQTVYAPSVSGATVSGTSVKAVLYSGAGILDEDAMGSDSNTHLSTQQAIKAYVDSRTAGAAANYILKDGSVDFTSNQSMGSNKLTSVTNPTADQDAATKAYVDVNTVDVSANYILKDGSVAFTGDQSMGSNKLTSVTNPTALQDAATKYYVDLMASSPSGNYVLVDGSVPMTGTLTAPAVSATNVSGLTVYAPSVSGATVSGTSVKAVLYSGAGILDEDAMGSDSDTHLSTQQAIKAYVDSRTAGAAANYILKDGSVDFTGDQSMGSNKLTSVTDPTADQDAATKAYVDVNTVDVSGNYILKDGSVDFTGAQAGIAFGATEGVSGATLSGTTVEGVTVYAPSVSGATLSGTSVKAVLYSGAGILDEDAMGSDSNTHLSTQQAIKAYVDSRTAGAAANYILKDGSVDFTGDQSMGSNKLTNVTDPGSAQDAATKAYVDSQAHGGGGGSLWTAVPATNSIYYSSGTNVSAVGIGVTAPHATLEVNGEVSAVNVGATEGVSGATVSGTTVEGQTVYAPSVSGATVSGTSVKAVLYSGAGILDEDAMGSDSNTHLSTQQAIKAYVDSRTAGAAANYILKDGSVDFTSNQSMGSNKLTSVTDPTADQDAATKAYVDVNTVDVSGNYILKDGSVDFTGAQAGIAFGATEGVSGATVSGTTVEGVTVYGTSVSGATVSGTAVKAVLYSGAGILDEDAMGSDSNTHLSTQQAIKAYVDSRTAGAAANYILKGGSVAFTGDQSMGSNKLTSVTDPASAQDAATKAYVDSRTAGAAANYILKDGSVDFTGAQAGIAFGATEGVSGATVSGTTIEGLTVYATSVSGATVSGTSVKAVLYSGAGILDEDAMGTDSNTHLATQQSIKAYVDSRTAGAAANYILKDGSVDFTGDQSMGSNKLTSVTDPTADQDAATKAYVDVNTVDVSSDYVIKSPSTTDRNLIVQGSTSRPPFAIQQAESGSSDLTQWDNSDEAKKAWLDKDFKFNAQELSGTAVKAVLYSGAGILDEDAMGSDSDTHLSTQQAIKAYVDSRTAGAAANYILKDGSVAFTGDQSMGSNKLTSVTDPGSAQDAATKAYVDSRTAGVAANYILKDGSVDFTAAQAGVSGTADASLTTNLMAFQRPFQHTAYRSGSFSNGQQIRLFLNTTDNDANFVIPAGETLKILAAYGRCKSGATAGTTTWTLGIQTWETQAHSGARDWDLATGSTTDTNSYINIMARGTLASPLATIVGADDPVGMVFLEHANGGGGSSGNDKHTIDVYGVFVDS